MTAYDYLKNHVVSILKPSRISGVGFFAIRNIEEGESIFYPWGGESEIYYITHSELFTLPDELKKTIYETFDNRIYYIDKDGVSKKVEKEYGKLFFPLEKGCHWVYTYPKLFINSGLHNSNVDTINNIIPIATKNIKKGEELLANYGSNFKITPKNFI
jgi:hypothetical protein